MSRLAAYDLDSLGWLLYERLATDAAELELGVRASAWQGSSDELREAVWEPGLEALGIPGPAILRMVWVRRSRGDETQASARLADVARGRHRRPLVLMTNAAEDELPAGARVAHTLGQRWLSAALERRGALRAIHPSALGVRAGGPAIVRETPSFDTAAAATLARVFVPVSAHARALAVLHRHRFAVLTGPPEMGKTAIARMIGLGLATGGWEVHECIRPQELWREWDEQRAQVFIADDAFGSTEYRPDAAEHWAREMERILRALDERHFLIWTSRPAPLRAGLRRIHRERGAEHFPRPGEVLVDAAALDRGEKALILFRHAKAAGASGTTTARLLQAHGEEIVEDPHFTPERIRRFTARRLFRIDPTFEEARAVAALLREELREPTNTMAASFGALDAEHRSLLVAMLDCPPGAVAERVLAAAARRHTDAGLPHSPAELMDRLADHFLRIADMKVSWVHPSWRDLVVDALAADGGARRTFLERCELDGALLALSVGGGRGGERSFPLLAEDADWDLLGDRLVALVRETDDHDTLRALVALSTAYESVPQRKRAELRALAESVLATLRRRWDRAPTPVAVAPLVAWLELADDLGVIEEIPHWERTWFALMPAAREDLRDDDLRLADDWLWLAQTLADLRPQALLALDFPDAYAPRLKTLWKAAAWDPLGINVRRRLARLLPALGKGWEEPDVPELEPAADEPDGGWVAYAYPARDDAAGAGTVARILRDL